MKFLNIVVFYAIAVILAGCATSKSVENVSPEISVDGISITDVSFDGVDLMAAVSSENDPNAGSGATRYNYRIIIGGQTLASGSVEPIPDPGPHSGSTAKVPFTIDYKDVFQRFGDLGDRETLPFIMETTLISDPITADPANKPVQIDSLASSIPVLKKPGIVIDTLMLHSFNLAVATLELRLRVVNPNAFPVMVTGLNFDLIVEETEWHHQELADRIEVPAKSDIVINTPFSMRPRDFSTEVYRMLNMSQEFGFTVKGGADFTVDILEFQASESADFKLSQIQKFDRLGN